MKKSLILIIMLVFALMASNAIIAQESGESLPHDVLHVAEQDMLPVEEKTAAASASTGKVEETKAADQAAKPETVTEEPENSTPVEETVPEEKPVETTVSEPVTEEQSEQPAAETPSETPVTEPAAAETPAETPATEPAAAETPAETPATEPAAAETPAETPATEPAAAETPAETPATEPAAAETKSEETTTETAAADPVKYIVTITGAQTTATYDGTEKKAEGFSIESCMTPDGEVCTYSESDMESIETKPMVTGTETGTYELVLDPEMFINKKEGVEVEFVFVNGYLQIDPVQTPAEGAVVVVEEHQPENTENTGDVQEVIPEPTVNTEDPNMTIISGPIIKINTVAEPTNAEPTDAEQTDAEQTVDEPTDAEQTVEGTTDAEQTVEEPTDAEQPVEGTTDAEQNVEGTNDAEQPVEGTTDAQQTVDENTDAEQTVEEPTDAEQNVDENTDDEQTVEEPTDAEQTVDENTDDEQNDEDEDADDADDEQDDDTDEPEYQVIHSDDIVAPAEEQPAEEAAADETAAAPAQTLTLGAETVIFAAADEGGEVVFTTAEEAEWTVISVENGWALVQLPDGATGYVRMPQTEETESVEEAPSLTVKAATPVRLAADGMSEIIFSSEEDADVTVLGKEGDWLKVRLADGTEGYIYAADIDAEAAEPEKPAEILNVVEEAEKPAVEKKVTIFTDRHPNMWEGEMITLTSRLDGFEDCVSIQYQWECDKGSGFEAVEGGTAESYSYPATLESLNWGWRLTVQYK